MILSSHQVIASFIYILAEMHINKTLYKFVVDSREDTCI
jgi:hypothetical protein